MPAIDSARLDNTTARTAGLLYLVVVATGIFSLGYVPTQINVAGDAAATMANITASESLFRLGILAGVACYIAFLLLPLVLHRLLRSVDTTAAVLMVAFALVQVPIFFFNLVHKLDVLTLLGGAGTLQAFTEQQLHAQAVLALASYGNGMLLSEVFMGLWLLPFGYLVFRSGVLPRILGVLLMAGCVGYLVDFSCTLLLPAYPESAIAGYVTMPASVGEIGTCLWLLVVGVRVPRSSLASLGPVREID